MILLASLQFPVVLQFLYPKHCELLNTELAVCPLRAVKKPRIDKMQNMCGAVAHYRFAWLATVAPVASACPIQNDLQRGEISLPNDTKFEPP